MSITITDSTKEPRSFSIANRKLQILDYVINSGETSGTITADRLSVINHVLVLGGTAVFTAAPTYATNIATMAFTVPAETASSRTLQSALTFTATANQGAAGNNVTITFTAGATAGAEVVTVLGTAITIQVESGVSTATQVKTAYDLVAAAIALATVAIVGGHSADPISAATVLALQNGVTGGARGSLLAIGI